MKKITYISFLLSLIPLWSHAQTARLQAIHNSADEAAAVVDIYLTTPLGSDLLINDFAFRTASPFIDAPAGIPITLGIAPENSQSIDDTIPGLSFDYNLESGETYILIAEGIVSQSGYNPATPFDIAVYPLGQEAANETGNTDVLVHHGSTDAPTVDIREREAGILVDNAPFGAFSDYLELPTADYILDVQDETGMYTVASFGAPLATLNLDDAAVVAVASGFLDPSQNSDGPGFGIFVALPAGGPMVSLPMADMPTARVQVIHNSADAAAEVVDIYLDDELLLDDFAFRTATPFVDLPATKDITVSIAPANSDSVIDTIPGLSFDYNLAIGETYILIAGGIVSPSGYTPATPFDIAVYPLGQEAANETGNTDVLVHHGSTDAPTVDIREREAGILVDNAPFGAFSDYLELPTADYILDVQDETGMYTVASFGAPLATLNLDDAAVVAVASGFLDPSQNSDGPAFGIYVALPAGGPLVSLPMADMPTARVQVIHNSADAAAEVVDIYLDDELLLDDFAFRTATPFVDLPATKDITVSIAPANSDSVIDTIPGLSFDYNLAIGETYILIAGGIVSPSGYTPATPFDIAVYPLGQEAANETGNTDVLVHHGSTDAPTVDIREREAGILVDNAPFGAFSDYLELPTADYILDVQDETGMYTVASFGAPLATLNLDDAAVVAVASGFLDPSQNSDGPAFGIYVALPAGGPLVALPMADMPTARVQVIHNSADAAAEVVDIYLDNELLLDDFAFRTATPFVDLPATKDITVSIAPANSDSVIDTIPGLSFDYNLAIGETYILIAGGIVSPSGYTPATPFDIAVYPMGRESASQGGNTDVLVYHGSTDAPTVDVYEMDAGELINDLDFGAFSDDYLELTTANYTLEVRDETGTTIVKSYAAPLSQLSLDNQAIVVLASGFFDPSANTNGAEFGLFVALGTGGELVPLPENDLTSVSDLVNNQVAVFPNPVSTSITIESQQANIKTITVYDLLGTLVAENNFQGNAQTLNMADLSAGIYQLKLTLTSGETLTSTIKKQ